MSDRLLIERCGCCSDWVASYRGWEVEDPCPLRAARRVLSIAIEMIPFEPGGAA